MAVPLHCENALMRAMNIFRYIRAANPSRVMEFGPGSGYLGLLHILSGIPYIAIENTQAFYLLQNRIWSAASEGKFCELATEPMSLREAGSRLSEYRAVHVPWWKAVDLDMGTPPVTVDVVTANHCLAEMQDNAMKYYARLAHAALKAKRGPFLFEGWGYELLRSRGIVAREFDAAGFHMAHVEERAVAFSSDHAMAGGKDLPRPVRFREKLRNLNRRFLRLEPVPHGYEVASHSGSNPLSDLVRQTQEETRKKASIRYSEVAEFLAAAYDNRDESEEDRFLALIGKSYL